MKYKKTLECAVGFHSECGMEYEAERKNCKCKCHAEEQKTMKAAVAHEGEK